VPWVALAYFWMKRLVNLGMSRVWLLEILAPVLNLWVSYRCFACPPGYAYHKKLDGTGIALAGTRFGFIDSTLVKDLLHRLTSIR
jgi:hypothetical protein